METPSATCFHHRELLCLDGLFKIFATKKLQKSNRGNHIIYFRVDRPNHSIDHPADFLVVVCIFVQDKIVACTDLVAVVIICPANARCRIVQPPISAHFQKHSPWDGNLQFRAKKLDKAEICGMIYRVIRAINHSTINYVIAPVGFLEFLCGKDFDEKSKQTSSQ